MKEKLRKSGAAIVRVFRASASAGGLAVLAIAGLPLLVVGVAIYPAMRWLAGKGAKKDNDNGAKPLNDND